MTVTSGRAPQLPAPARRLRLPLWDRSQSRLRERHGWDLSAPDAVERARALVAADPRDPQALLLLASALSMSGDGTAALAAARQASELDPGSARAQTTIAAIEVQDGDAKAGLRHARRAAELDGKDPHVLFNLGLAEHATCDRRAARDAFIRSGAAIGIDLNPWWRRRRHRADGPDQEPSTPMPGDGR